MIFFANSSFSDQKKNTIVTIFLLPLTKSTSKHILIDVANCLLINIYYAAIKNRENVVISTATTLPNILIDWEWHKISLMKPSLD